MSDLLDEAACRQLARLLLAHYDREGRDLPWRRTRDPYSIWVAEIMLQQTGVKTVLPYHARFLERFPTLEALSDSSLEEVLAIWQGLGYYRRARHLHAAARMVTGELGGRFPDTLESLATLPGIGPSTAGAILAIAFGQHQAILDGNVKRVLARLVALEMLPDSTPGRRLLWDLARRLTPRDRPGDYAQAIMDLGAVVCTPRQPQCVSCLWQTWCMAWKSGDPERYPLRQTKAPKPRKYQFQALVLRPDGRVLLVSKEDATLLGGLWHLPGEEPGFLASPPEYERVRRHLAEQFGIRVVQPTLLEPVTHIFTHFHLTVFPFLCPWLEGEPPESAGARWIDWRQDRRTPLSTLHRKVLARLSGGDDRVGQPA
ncbi:MAG: A/G-specific adenine glycosylase [Magnetococcales bacterium]|nr:A/G-specific adenine glycosylase [Magnetococcales bacterium]